MDYRPMVVVEANEVPLRVVEDLAVSGRIPFFARLLEAGALVETEVDEILPRELYPAQSWASLNTGVAWSRHRISWYGDPKPARYPLFWQLAARADRSVGLVGTLHSSPLTAQCGEGDYRFAIPDCFAPDPSTLPARYRTFQEVNLALTSSNSRRVASRAGPRALAGLVRSLPTLGLRARTTADLITLIGGVVAGRVPRERIRSAQFLLQKDLFLRLLAGHRPDLAILFTNHVAAAMHRYWYALYPDDFAERHYPDEWVDRYRNEIPEAMVALDRFLGELDRWCRANERTLVVASSMGQGPSPRLDTMPEREAVVVDGQRFLQALDLGPGIRVIGSMTPQLTLACAEPGRASALATALAELDDRAASWSVDRSGEVVTVTYRLDVVGHDRVVVAGIERPAAELGVEIHRVDDHSSGRHVARGILGVANSPSFERPIGGVVSHLWYAPAILRHLGIEPPEHHCRGQLVV